MESETHDVKAEISKHDSDEKTTLAAANNVALKNKTPILPRSLLG